MTSAIVCVGDNCVGMPVHICMSGSENVFVNGRSVCRKGDILTLGETLAQGSETVFANGLGIAKAIASCGFRVMSSNKKVFIGEK